MSHAEAIKKIKVRLWGQLGLTVVLGAVLSLILCGQVFAQGELFSTQDVAHGQGSAYFSSGSSDRLAWIVRGGTNDGVFTWTPAGGTIQLDSANTSSSVPEVSGDRLAWSRDGEVYTWTPSGGVVQVTNDAVNDYSPVVSGDRIAWCRSDAGKNEIFTWTPGGGAVQLSDNVQTYSYPKISGDRVVWLETNGSNHEVWTWTPSGGAQRVTSGTSDASPGVSGDRIAWQRWDGVGLQICTWTPASGVVQLTSDATFKYFEGVSGDRVSWEYYVSSTNTEIYTWTAADGVVLVASGTAGGLRESGDRLVWGKQIGYYDEIFTWTPEYGVVQVTSNGQSNSTALTSGDRIVWTIASDPYTLCTATPTIVDNPSISSLDAPQGASSGGTHVVIHGTNFLNVVAPDAVKFGNLNATSYTVDSDTRITAVAPAHAAGSVDVQVKAAGGLSSITTASQFLYVDAPTISSVAPTEGTAAGGAEVVITGTNFVGLSGTAAVTFGGTNATSYTVNSDTRITATTPAHSVGATRVQVTAAGGATPDTSADDYIFRGAPTIEYVDSWSVEAGAISVEIHGTDFVGLTGADAVTFGGVNALSYTVVSPTLIQAVTPPHAPGTVQVRVKTPLGTSVSSATSTINYLVSTQNYGRYTVTGLTGNGHPKNNPRVSGDRVAWEDNDSYGGKVFTWSPSEGTTPLTPGNAHGVDVDVSANRVVWRSSGTNPGDPQDQIYTWTPTSGIVQLTTGYDPHVSGDRVVWCRSDGTDLEIFTWTPAGGEVQITSNGVDDAHPRVYGDRIVWEQEWTNAGVWHDDVYTWTPSTGIVRVTNDGLEKSVATVSGNRIAWSASVTGGQRQVFTWTPAGGKVQLTTTSDNMDPAVSGDRIAWAGNAGGDYEIYTWTPTSGRLQLTNNTQQDMKPAVSGDRIVWMSSAGKSSHLYTWTPQTGVVLAVSLECGQDSEAFISGNRIAFVMGFTGDAGPTVYTGVPSLPRTEQGDSRLSFAGNWTTYSSANHSGGSYAFSSAVGSSVTITFAGTKLNLIACRGPVFGIADVSVDGNTPVPMDLYDASLQYRQYAWSTGTLTNGLHTVKITCTGAKNPLATGTYVNIDAVETDGSLAATPLAQQNDARLFYSSGWATFASASFSGGSHTYTAATGASVTIPFIGWKLDWIGTLGPTFGIASVSVDNGPATTVDLYHAANEFQTTIWSTGPLAYGLHTVKITCSGTKNASSTNVYVGVDAVRVTGSLASAGRVEQTDPRFVYAKTWTLASSAYYSGGSYRCANMSGASVTINFTGVCLSYIARKAPNMGKAYVSIDGKTPVLVDLYAVSTYYRQTAYSTGVLPLGNHSVRIWWSGQKRPGASGTYINIDAVDVVGSVR